MNRPSIAPDRSTTADIVSGINVTPLVDITLVLLIVFMVTAKMLSSQSLSMEFPKESPGQEVQPVFGIELGANGDILVEGKRLPNDESVFPMAKEAYAKHAQLRVVIRADLAVQHGRVIHVLDLVKQAGITKVAFGVGAAAPASGGGSQPPPTVGAAPRR